MSDTPGGGPSRPEPSRESISEVARSYLRTWTAPEHGWRARLGRVAFLAGVATAAMIANGGTWADALSRHPVAVLSIAAWLLAWWWLEIVPELRTEPPVRRVLLAGAQLLVLVGMLLLFGPPGPHGQAWSRAAGAGALLCLVALSFRRSWSWAVAAALVAAAAGWILWGGGGSGPG